MKKLALVILIGMFMLALPVRGNEPLLLHRFIDLPCGVTNPPYGVHPHGSLILSGSGLYGMTLNDWEDSAIGGVGKIFQIDLNSFGGASWARKGMSGSECYNILGYSILHAFIGGASDGANPYGSLILSGSTFYGMTYAGGDNNEGAIFKIDGTGFILLHKFAGGADDGANPYGDLIISGTTLYGMTYEGGDYNMGTIFKIDTDGTGFALLHKFTGGADDGANPYGGLIISGTTLYGMTYEGGDYNVGTIFKIDTDGTGFAPLHKFAGGASDGANPYGSLILSGSTLYGMTSGGSNSYYGTIFKIDTDGTGFNLLHEFAGSNDDGATPWGNLILSGSTLYGMTKEGGDGNKGTIFKIQTDGTGFNLLHEFAGGGSDGQYPYGSLIISGSTLYGMTEQGGPSTGNATLGIVFALPLDAPPAPSISGNVTWNGTGLANVVMNGLPGNPTTDASGFYTATVDYGWSGTVTPTLAGCTFSPASTTYTMVMENLTTNYINIAPIVVVTSPNGGEQWQRGIDKTITWTSVGVTNIKILLMKGTVVNTNITNSYPAASGSYPWTVPAAQATGTDYKIRIVSKESAAVQDSSDDSFTIFAPSITVTAPATGASWQRGVVHTITWTKVGILDANVKIQLIKGTAVNSTIAESTENDGSFAWLIPAGQALAANYKIRIKTIDNAVTANSGKFSITN
jgi:uncharacterized repeat protein (TIGR03803 family)